MWGSTKSRNTKVVICPPKKKRLQDFNIRALTADFLVSESPNQIYEMFLNLKSWIIICFSMLVVTELFDQLWKTLLFDLLSPQTEQDTPFMCKLQMIKQLRQWHKCFSFTLKCLSLAETSFPKSFFKYPKKLFLVLHYIHKRN